MGLIENQRILSISRGGGKIAPGGGKIAPVYSTAKGQHHKLGRP